MVSLQKQNQALTPSLDLHITLKLGAIHFFSTPNKCNYHLVLSHSNLISMKIQVKNSHVNHLQHFGTKDPNSNNKTLPLMSLWLQAYFSLVANL